MKDGGPAFPYIEQFYDGRQTQPVEHAGMSLRDYFAAKAMQGILSCFRQWDVVENAGEGKRIEARAKLSYEIADAMLQERDR